MYRFKILPWGYNGNYGNKMESLHRCSYPLKKLILAHLASKQQWSLAAAGSLKGTEKKPQLPRD